MLTTTAPAAPDWCGQFKGFDCGCYPACSWSTYYYSYCGYPGCGSCGFIGSFPGYGYPAGYAAAGGDAMGEREKALEAQIRQLREEMKRQQGAKPKDEETAAPAHVVVRLPADARLFINDDACPLTSAERSFDTPDLERGMTYHYTIRAEVTREGRAVTASKRVTVEAGKDTVVEFGDLATAEAVSR
jgi:uncharacterized protein (TIGR03000 family)